MGIILALLSGIALGGITSFAALSYQYGAEPLSLIALRGLIAGVMMAALTYIAGASLRTGRGSLRHIIMIGLSLSMVGLGLMGAVAFISPGLAVAILYLYPLIVLTIDSIRTRDWPRLPTIAGFGIALIGILICLGASADLSLSDFSSDQISGPIIGLTLGLMAAFGMAFFLLTSAASTRAGYSSGVLVWANLLVVAITITLVLAALLLPPLFPGAENSDSGNSLGLPYGGVGWVAFFMAASLYALGVMFSILALRRISAPTTALMMNVEPLSTLIAAHLLIGEVLLPLQYGGMVIAIIGIIIGSYAQTAASQTQDAAHQA